MSHEDLAAALLGFPIAPEPHADQALKACVDVATFTAVEELGLLLRDVLFADGDAKAKAEEQLRAKAKERL